MKNLKVITMVLGEVSTNTYLVSDRKTGACVIVDPADDADRIAEKISAEGLKPERILLTHGHSDHFMAADGLREKYHIQVCALDREEKTLLDPELNTSESILGITATVRADSFFSDGDILDLAGEKWHVIATPGHTEGGCCYYIPDEKILFSGDTLFCGSYGRCDLPGGDERAIAKSITEKLLTLPEDTIVFPGHMESTTIGDEKKYNPLAVYERSLKQ